jgi:hypothetical protein
MLGGGTKGDTSGIRETLLIDEIPDFGGEFEEGKDLALWKRLGRTW